MAEAKKRPKKQRVKAGTNRGAYAERKRHFIDAYIANGRNATQAAITAGYSPHTARVTGSALLTEPDIAEALALRAEEVQAISGLTVERTLREIARLCYIDPRRLYRENGTLKDPSEWDDDLAATISNIEVFEEYEGYGQDRKLVGYTKKVKFWDKNAALEKAMKHLGMFERDNSQRAPNLAIQVNLVGPTE